jgi:hypothetical protein
VCLEEYIIGMWLDEPDIGPNEAGLACPGSSALADNEEDLWPRLESPRYSEGSQRKLHKTIKPGNDLVDKKGHKGTCVR